MNSFVIVVVVVLVVVLVLVLVVVLVLVLVLVVVVVVVVVVVWSYSCLFYLPVSHFFLSKCIFPKCLPHTAHPKIIPTPTRRDLLSISQNIISRFSTLPDWSTLSYRIRTQIDHFSVHPTTCFILPFRMLSY